MSIDRETLDERLDPEYIREELDERLDPSAARDRVDEFYAKYFLPPSVTDDLEAAAAETDDGEFGEFEFGAWLDQSGATGPQAPPTEPRVVTGAVATTAEPAEPVGADYSEFEFAEWLGEEEALGVAGGPAASTASEDAGVADAAGDAATDAAEFDFQEWLVTGDSYDPIDVLEPEAEAVEEAAVAEDPAVPEGPEEPVVSGPSFDLHPAKAATFALFLAVVALTALTIVGYLPALGPATGL